MASSPSLVTTSSGLAGAVAAADPEREWREAFALFDKAGRGAITVSELKTVLEQLGAQPSAAELAAFLAAVDANGDGKVEYHEFVQLMTKKVRVPESLAALRAAFRVLDEKGSGKVHAGELRYVLTGVGAPEIRLSGDEVDEVLKEVGVDADGYLDYEQLLQQFVATQ